MKTEILQRFQVLLILFLIYISIIFDEIANTSLIVISPFFIDNLEFIASGSSVKKVAKVLEKVVKIILEWGP